MSYLLLNPAKQHSEGRLLAHQVIAEPLTVAFGAAAYRQAVRRLGRIDCKMPFLSEVLKFEPLLRLRPFGCTVRSRHVAIGIPCRKGVHEFLYHEVTSMLGAVKRRTLRNAALHTGAPVSSALGVLSMQSNQEENTNAFRIDLYLSRQHD